MLKSRGIGRAVADTITEIAPKNLRKLMPKTCSAELGFIGS